MENNKVQLSCEGEVIDVDIDVAQKSTVLKNMIEDTGSEGEIPIPNMRMSILRKILEFCEYYKLKEPKEIKKPLPSSDLKDFLDEWDAKFIDMEKIDDWIDLIVGVNFWDIESLLNLGCAKVASLIKGKTVEEIRDIFGIEKDFTSEEENQLIEENKWAEDII